MPCFCKNTSAKAETLNHIIYLTTNKNFISLSSYRKHMLANSIEEFFLSEDYATMIPLNYQIRDVMIERKVHELLMKQVKDEESTEEYFG